MPIVDLGVKGETKFAVAVDSVRAVIGPVTISGTGFEPVTLATGEKWDAAGKSGLRVSAEKGARLLVAYKDRARSDYTREDVLN